MTHITMTDLIYSLRMAAAHPEAHASAQQEYFSKIQENSVLVNHGTACCVAGYLMLKAHEGEPAPVINNIIENSNHPSTPGAWVAHELGLSHVERTLAFDASTHYEVHLLLADLLEAGLRLPGVERMSICQESTYTRLDWAHLADTNKYLRLHELKEWMRSIAK